MFSFGLHLVMDEPYDAKFGGGVLVGEDEVQFIGLSQLPYGFAEQ